MPLTISRQATRGYDAPLPPEMPDEEESTEPPTSEMDSALSDLGAAIDGGDMESIKAAYEKIKETWAEMQ